MVGEHDSSRNTNAAEGPRINVSGDFVSGSAQSDSFGTEYNFHFYDMATWTRGKHMIRAGVDTPHIARRAFDDHTNELGSYTFGPTLAADGVKVLQTALQNYTAGLPSGFSQNTGDTHFIYHQQEMGAFIQDQYKIDGSVFDHARRALRLAEFSGHRRLGFSPRVSFAWVLDEQEDRGARRRRHLLRSVRLRPAAGPGALPEGAAARDFSVAEPSRHCQSRLRIR